MTRILVCGGRQYSDNRRVADTLRPLVNEETVLIEGGAAGADYIARLFAERHNIPVLTFAADWSEHGKGAGPIRNQKMIDEGRPDLVVAFPGGRGTADMVRRAERAGVTIQHVQQREG